MKQGINLIPSSVLATRARRRRLRVWIALDTLTAAALAAILLVGHPEASGLVERLRAEHEEAAASLTTAQESLARTVESLRQARANQAVARRLGARPDFSGLLRTIAQELDARATLDQVLIAPLAIEAAAPARTPAPADGAGPAQPVRPREQYRVMISGIAANAGIASEFVLRLERTGYFDSVSITSTTSRPLGEVPAVEFHVAGVLGEGRLPVIPAFIAGPPTDPAMLPTAPREAVVEADPAQGAEP